MHTLTLVYSDGSTRTIHLPMGRVDDSYDHAECRRAAHTRLGKETDETDCVFALLIDGTDGETLQLYCKGATF